MQPISVALLISTYNWPGALELVLQSISMQSRMPDEIVIADDGSGEATQLLIADFKQAHNLNIKHIWHQDQGFRKSRILNKAVHQISSDYIIEIDGDIIIDAHFVEDHLNAARPNYFVQGSRTMISQEKSVEIMHTRQLNLSILSKGLINRFNALRIPALSGIFQIKPSNPFHIKGCNIAFWKSDYIRINGYDNGFEGWGGEDYEFAARLLHAGLKRTTLKMAAIAFHIYHLDNSRENTVPNDKIYRKTIAEKLDYSSNGYEEVREND